MVKCASYRDQHPPRVEKACTFHQRLCTNELLVRVSGVCVSWDGVVTCPGSISYSCSGTNGIGSAAATTLTGKGPQGMDKTFRVPKNALIHIFSSKGKTEASFS